MVNKRREKNIVETNEDVNLDQEDLNPSGKDIVIKASDFKINLE